MARCCIKVFTCYFEKIICIYAWTTNVTLTKRRVYTLGMDLRRYHNMCALHTCTCVHVHTTVSPHAHILFMWHKCRIHRWMHVMQHVIVNIHTYTHVEQKVSWSHSVFSSSADTCMYVYVTHTRACYSKYAQTHTCRAKSFLITLSMWMHVCMCM